MSTNSSSVLMPEDRRLADQVAALVPRASSESWARRLRSLESAVREVAQADPSAELSPEALSWLEADLPATFPATCLRPTASDDPKWLARLDILRVALIFLPIVITWFGIWAASNAYESLLKVDPEAARRPFIALWQTGFDGQLAGGMTLGRVAVADFLVILSVICLTIFASAARQRSEERARRADDSGELAGLLGDCGRVLAAARYSSPLRFGAELTKAVADVRKLHSGIKTATDSISDRVRDAAAVAASMGDDVSKLTTTAADLAAAVVRVEGIASEARDAALEAVGKNAANVSSQNDALRKLDSSLDGFALLSGEFTTASRELATIVDGIRTAQTELNTAMADERRLHQQLADSAERAAEKLDTVTSALNPTATTIRDLNDGLASLTQGFESSLSSATSEVRNAATSTHDVVQRQAELTDLLRRTTATVEVAVEQTRASVLDMNRLLADTLALLRQRAEQAMAGGGHDAAQR